MVVPETEIIVSQDGAEILRKTVPPGEYVIGREAACDLQVEIALVSRRHAQLTVNYDHFLIEDLGSSNGTLVNGQPVTTPTRLWPNQKIQIGSATIELRRIKTPSLPDVSLAPSAAAVQRLLPETLLRDQKYEIGKVVAQGGMGAILDAREAAIERRVAMKVMLDSSDPDALARFVAEAKITGQLEHPNIVPIYELSVDEHGQPFYTMKMVRGITLKKVLDLLAEGTAATLAKYPLPALLTIFQKVCDALAFAHSHGVIHRDLKPENLMLDDFGVVLVMDWGLAKRIADPEKRVPERTEANADGASEPNLSGFRFPQSGIEATLVGTIMGTPAFMSPEQARGEIDSLDSRSDLYALGAILYQILALRPPVRGHTAMDIVEKVKRGEIEPLFAVAADRRPTPLPHLPGGRIPASLAAIVGKAMAFDPAARYARAEELQADLLAYQNGFATSAEKASAWKQFTLLVKRHKATSIGVAAVLVIGGVLGTKAVIEGRRAEREAVRANRALADLKKQAPGLRELAESEASFQRFDSALAKLDGAIALEPEFLPAYWRRAWLLMGMERFGDAASAIRLAQEKDPANAKLAAILPVIEQLAAAASDADRWSPERATALLAHLRKVEATREIGALSAKLQLGAKDKLALVQKRIEEWLGEGWREISTGEAGLVAVRIPTNLETLEPLRGLPIGKLTVGGNKLVSLEPLRGMQLRDFHFDISFGIPPLLEDLSPLEGMPLRTLHIHAMRVNDLAPLKGMPLETLDITRTPVQDLSPLKGMPLTTLLAEGSKVIDLSPLAGAPLRRLQLNGTEVTDFTPIKGALLESLELSHGKSEHLTPITGAPLKDVNIAYSRIKDLKFLQNSPITKINARNAPIDDLSPLRGKPLLFLDIAGTIVSDLAPLRSAPIDELFIFGTKVTDFSPLLDLPKLERVRVSKNQKTLEPLRRHPTLKFIGFEQEAYKPVAQFWSEYDAQRAAPK